MDAITIEQPRTGFGQIAMPDEVGALANIDPRVFRIQREIDASAIPGRPQWPGFAAPDADRRGGRVLAGVHEAAAATCMRSSRPAMGMRTQSGREPSS